MGSCDGDLVCARIGYDDRNFGECPSKGHCCSRQGNFPQGSIACWDVGSDMASRDASCDGDLVCARIGYDGRNLGDCPSTGHCCSSPHAPTPITQPPAPTPDDYDYEDYEEPDEPTCLQDKCFNKRTGNVKRKRCIDGKNGCATCSECDKEPEDHTRCEDKCYNSHGAIKSEMCAKNKCARCAEC